MAQNNSNNTTNPPSKASGNEAGFGASGEKVPANGKKFPRGMLPALFAAAALGGGVMFANLDREDEPRTFTNQEFNGAAVISQDALFFEANSREYKYYQSLVSDGKIGAGDSYIKLSNNLETIYNVSPMSVNGVSGVKYEDVTANVQSAHFNDDLMVSGYHMREFSGTLSFFEALNQNFDQSVGIVKTAGFSNNQPFSYHMYRNDDGVVGVNIVDDAYQSANSEILSQAKTQMDDMWGAAMIRDGGVPWDAFYAKVHHKCATSPECQL